MGSVDTNHIIHPISGGKRTDWNATGRTSNLPLITIITATFNAINDLPWTIQSIRKQSYDHIQFIVADGASKDGTIDLLRQNEEVIDYWFSEPDTGIFNAWNKALEHVQGEWVLFLGAGDELASDTLFQTLAPVLATSFPAHELVYGNMLCISINSRAFLYKRAKSWKVLKGKWVFFRPELPDHGTVFHHNSLFFKSYRFDESYKIAADSHVLLKSIKNKDPLYTDTDICKVSHGGNSASIGNYYRMAAEVYRINRELGIKPPLMHVIITKVKLIIKVTIVKYIPLKTAFAILDFFRVMQGLGKKWSIR